ncbi:uncharacterized protein PSFLO_00115 [Pseudozyma flocculosa]|uniref:T-cell immunomodulatory protein TIP C2 domain-containing protein n=2 Tax=Pseudozyma flocculosa TaxID=84751 RepID=A0A5C3EQJ9_9BASI|nr:uncharacterized protein PSFLO_00115 [Pseudozyma flocculosa]
MPSPRSASTSTATTSPSRPSRTTRRSPRRRGRLLPALLASAALVPTGSHALFGFGDKRFKYEGLINAGSLGLDRLTGQVVAWGDWNGDQFLDAITLDSDRRSIAVHQWNHKTFSFEPKAAATLSLPPGIAATNIVAADLNYDGRLDLLVMSQSATASSSDELNMSVYLGTTDGSGFEQQPIPAPPSTLAQPLSIDAAGDMQMDLLGHPSSRMGAAPGSDGSSLKLWRNLLAESNRTSTDAFDIVDAPFLTPNGPAPACKLSNPHSSAYVDLNGDCLADLFLVCGTPDQLTYQIWTATKPETKHGESGFTLATSGSLPPGTGALSFADMDRDGTIDVIFPTCDSRGDNCFINVAYNRQVPLCSIKSDGLFGSGPGSNAAAKRRSISDEATAEGLQRRALPLTCRDPQDLCTADDKFRFDFSIRDDNSDLLRVPLQSLTGDARYLAADSLAPSGSAVPTALQLGDFNKDGHPDIALVTVPAKRSGGGSNDAKGLGETRVHLLQNEACSEIDASDRSKLGCRAGGGQGDGRTFIKVQDGAEVLGGFNDVRTVSWIDVDEDGTLDLMLQRKPANGDGKDGSRRVTFIQNNYFYDAFFLKSLTLNGACQSFCEPEGQPRFRPWGTNYGGASYKFTVLDPNGIRRAQQVGQLPQTSYRSLLTPYSYFGLGRTNNYVESLFIGSTRRQKEHYLAVEGIIPNSQVVINPWQGGDPTTADRGDPGMWTKQLYLSPGDWIPWVTVVLITTIIGLAVIVVVLHLNERREDERERKRAVHAINFDAL